MRACLMGVAVLAAAATPLFAPPPPKDTTAVPDEVALAEPAGGTDVEQTRARNKSRNNLRQIALAAHNYESANGKFPQDVYDANGKPLLSWRVLLVPYFESADGKNALEFKIDEPWDSRTNKAFLEKMPDVYASPRVTVKKKGYTVYQGFAGKGALFGADRKLGILNILDGTSNTLFAVEATAAVPWTKPSDVPFDEKKDLPDFGKAFASTPLAAMCDGSVRVLDTKKISMATLKAAVTIAGGEVLGPDW